MDQHKMEVLKGCINFWESKLLHDRYLLESSTEVLITETVSFLKQLERVDPVNQTPEKS